MNHLERELQALINDFRNERKGTPASKTKLNRAAGLIKRAYESGSERLRKLALALMLLLGTSYTYGQYFAPVQTNPFGINVSNELTQPVFVDIDGDGDLDMFNAGYYGVIDYQENTGSATNPSFGAASQFPFGLAQPYQYIITMTFGDLDGDGDYDLLTNGDIYNQTGLMYYENTGTNVAPNFAAGVADPFSLSSLGANIMISWPQLVDIDNDGDLDVIAGVYDSYYAKHFVYFENTGNATAPSFAAPVDDPFGLQGQFNRFAIPSFADLDGDGDLDMVAGGNYDTYYNGQTLYLENTGSASAASFGTVQVNAFNIIDSAYYFSFPTLADIDGDGDYDLIYGEYDYTGASIFYQENLGFNSVPELESNVSMKVYPQPCVDQAQIESSERISEVILRSSAGQVISKVNVNDYRLDLPMSQYASGVYYLEIVTKVEKRTLKLIKK